MGDNLYKGRHVAILLATYNSSDYLDELLQSFVDQDVQDFVIHVRDDGSKDDTFEKLLAWKEKVFGDRLILEPDRTPTGGPIGNFAHLMAATDADWVMFADHDDVWLPNRVSVSLALMEEAEARHGADTPIYGFTDVVPVDGDLSPLGESFWTFKKIDPEIAGSLSQSLICPPMLGCASILNRSLIDLALPIPADEVTGHDWWTLLLAVAAGRAVFSAERTVLYRMHGANASSQVRTSVRQYSKVDGKRRKVLTGLGLRWKQAEAVEKRLAETADPKMLQTIRGFVSLRDKGFFSRRVGFVRGGYLYPDWIRTSATLLLC